MRTGSWSICGRGSRAFSPATESAYALDLVYLARSLQRGIGLGGVTAMDVFDC